MQMNKEHSWLIKRILLVLPVYAACIIVMAFITSILLYYRILKPDSVGYTNFACMAVSSFLAMIFMSKNIGAYKWVYCATCTGVIWLVQWLAAVLLYGAGFRACIMNALPILAGGSICALLIRAVKPSKVYIPRGSSSKYVQKFKTR